jgi:hypothetical protein
VVSQFLQDSAHRIEIDDLYLQFTVDFALGIGLRGFGFVGQSTCFILSQAQQLMAGFKRVSTVFETQIGFEHPGLRNGADPGKILDCCFGLVNMEFNLDLKMVPGRCHRRLLPPQKS